MDSKHNLETAIESLAERENAFEKALTRQALAEYGYKLRNAQEFDLAEGSVKAREMTALLNCAAELKEYVESSAAVEIWKTKMRDVQLAVSARQSILSAEMKNFTVSEKFQT